MQRSRCGDSHCSGYPSKIDDSIRGIVFLSGSEDSYVERNLTLQTLRKNASHFEVKSYDGALHELDNELPEVTTDLYESSVRFQDSVTSRLILRY